MNQTRSCPMGHSSLQAQRNNPDVGALTRSVASPASPPRHDGSSIPPVPHAVGGWWAFAAQARAVTATA